MQCLRQEARSLREELKIALMVPNNQNLNSKVKESKRNFGKSF